MATSASPASGELNVSQRRQGTGRPRDPEVERRALEAARLIYGESGKVHVTFANIAARAGIGKPALYRRWQTPQDLLMEALRAIPLPKDIPDLGDAQAELAGYARDLMRLYVSPDGVAMMRVTTEFHDETEPFRQWIAETSESMIALAAQVVERAVHRGEPRPRLPARTIIDIITGATLSRVMSRLHAGQLPSDEEVAEYCWNLAGLVLDPPESSPSRRVPHTRHERHSSTGGRRNELIRIAQHVVAQRGVAEVTLAHVAKSAGMTPPALYTHFSSRTDLLEQVLETTANEYAEDIRVTDDADACVQERLRIRLSRWATTPNARLRLLHDAVLHMPDSPRVERAAQRALAAWVHFVGDVLERGIARGEVRADVDVRAATELFSTSVLGAELGAATGLVDASLQALSVALVDMFVAYLRSPGPSATSIDGRVGSDLRSS